MVFFLPYNTSGYTLNDWVLEGAVWGIRLFSIITGLIVHFIHTVISTIFNVRHIRIDHIFGGSKHTSSRVQHDSTMGTGTPDKPYRVAIVGSGFSGVGMAVKLKQHNIHNFVILERQDDVGGVWRDNSYPGCACDVPSYMYSFSFEQFPFWSKFFAPRGDIYKYLQATAKKYDLMKHCKFSFGVAAQKWHVDKQLWEVKSADGSVVWANVVVLGMGGLSDPAKPNIPGFDKFKGTWFHSAQWRHDVDLKGKRVAAIGTGASAIQFIPEIQPLVKQLTVFQRTAPWVGPRFDFEMPHWFQKVLAVFPPLQYLLRAIIYWSREGYVLGLVYRSHAVNLVQQQATRMIQRQAKKPDLIEKLTPKYQLGCKRVLLSNDYYPALSNDNVYVDVSGVKELKEKSIVSKDGKTFDIDVLILGIGFEVDKRKMESSKNTYGIDGVDLVTHWRNGMTAHLGAITSGFPNNFFLMGPNTGLGHNSQIYMIEAGIQYVMDCIEYMNKNDITSVDVKPEAEAAFAQTMQKKLQNTVWSKGGCKSWYLDPVTGQNNLLYPGFTWQYMLSTRFFDADNFNQVHGKQQSKHSKTNGHSKSNGVKHD